ncbi:MAG TPA: glycogen debranching N-terminal domain-containing protein, partial [Candidatus Limnocylindrales bacterium]|nr:glycogen debranching N-terminal domain-containing protein [Candidatus Limnocylindrales bacterium]
MARPADAPPPASISRPRRTAGRRAKPDGGVAFVEPRTLPIEKATDLGSVQVLKHGNLYLLTDPFGDIRPDSRGLGLYLSDTRLLSCCSLRISGTRPVLLQGSMGANYRGSIQLTNPSADRNPDAKMHPDGESVAGRTLGIARDRLIGIAGLEERIRIVNHAGRELSVPVELELGADDADIFEVRGYPRPDRGTLLPVALTPTRATFRYDGLDGRRRSTFVAFSEAANAFGPIDMASDDQVQSGGSVRFRWDLRLGPGERRELRWTVWPAISGPMDRRPGETGVAANGAASSGAETNGATNVETNGATNGSAADGPAGLFPEPPRVSADDGASAYHAWGRGTTAI